MIKGDHWHKAVTGELIAAIAGAFDLVRKGPGRSAARSGPGPRKRARARSPMTDFHHTARFSDIAFACSKEVRRGQKAQQRTAEKVCGREGSLAKGSGNG